jgi:WD40 repeat protein
MIRCVSVSPNGKLLVCSIDYGGEPDHLWVWSIDQEAWAYKQTTTNRLNNIAFTRDGQRLMAAHHNGFVNLWKVAPDGQLSDERRIGRIGGNCTAAVFSSDEKSIFAVTEVATGADGQLCQLDTETGEELWRSPRLEKGFMGIALLGPERLITVGSDDRVRIWQRRAVPKPK